MSDLRVFSNLPLVEIRKSQLASSTRQQLNLFPHAATLIEVEPKVSKSGSGFDLEEEDEMGLYHFEDVHRLYKDIIIVHRCLLRSVIMTTKLRQFVQSDVNSLCDLG